MKKDNLLPLVVSILCGMLAENIAFYIIRNFFVVNDFLVGAILMGIYMMAQNIFYDLTKK